MLRALRTSSLLVGKSTTKLAFIPNTTTTKSTTTQQSFLFSNLNQINNSNKSISTRKLTINFNSISKLNQSKSTSSSLLISLIDQNRSVSNTKVVFSGETKSTTTNNNNSNNNNIENSSSIAQEWVAYHEFDPASVGKHSRLTKEQISQMKQLRLADPQRYTQKTLAKMFNVSRLIVARYAKCAPEKKETLKKQEEERLATKDKLYKEKMERKQLVSSWFDKFKKRETDAVEKRREQSKQQFEQQQEQVKVHDAEREQRYEAHLKRQEELKARQKQREQSKLQQQAAAAAGGQSKQQNSQQNKKQQQQSNKKK